MAQLSRIFVDEPGIVSFTIPTLPVEYADVVTDPKSTPARGLAVPPSEFTIRCLQRDEWRLLKALRLRALACDPQSYWESVEDASARDDAYWNTCAGIVTTPAGSRMFLVEHPESVAAFVFGIKKDDDAYSVGGLWVDPVHRRKGLGSLLVQQVVTWARADSHAARIRLWCHTGPPLSFYQRNGFQSLDRFRTNDLDGRQIVEMEWRDI
ncbi:GNAT family N-acetyltransferase [Paraburkholderia sp. J10-1]|uniref:GNAT family N-acetyltransferase n=1 Tax=Paraburkholderia sp. J10-1 TaxID=2805430 RepID=UPI002AB60B68|nr:GNAT family N-acetyltransferase [Paraburkholderia sp. J10-1]